MNDGYISGMTIKKSTHGGPNRGQGRKPLEEGAETVPITVRVTRHQQGKLQRLGGAPWVRQRIDKAREP